MSRYNFSDLGVYCQSGEENSLKELDKYLNNNFLQNITIISKEIIIEQGLLRAFFSRLGGGKLKIANYLTHKFPNLIFLEGNSGETGYSEYKLVKSGKMIEFYLPKEISYGNLNRQFEIQEYYLIPELKEELVIPASLINDIINFLNQPELNDIQSLKEYRKNLLEKLNYEQR